MQLHINAYAPMHKYTYTHSGIYVVLCSNESLLAPQLIHQVEHFGAYDQYAPLHLGAPSPLRPGVMPAKVYQL